VLFFGSIKAYKGLDVLARAIPLVRTAQAHPHIIFWIVGRLEDETERAHLESLAGTPDVRVIAQYIPSDRVWAYHAAADVVIFPYHQISQSAALATALAFGCAVIATRVGGLPDLVGDHGWLIPPKDAEALARAIVEAAAQPRAALDGLRDRARASVEERFSSDSIARQHSALYASLIAAQ
jgi:glycosyltransferase involved in cell wall biosynthesis